MELSGGGISALENGGARLTLSGSVWNIEVTEQSGEVKTYTASDMRTFDFCVRGNRLELFWRGRDLTVRAAVVCEGEALRFRVAVASDGAGINRVVYPVFGGISPIAGRGEEDTLLLPWQNGVLIKDPAHTLLRNTELPFWMGRGGGKYENEYPAQYSYQFFAYYSRDSHGLYFSTEDGGAYIKTVGFYRNDDCDGFDFALTNYPENMGIERYYDMPYDFVFRFFKGDWQTAANLYRAWAVHQPWSQNSRGRELPHAARRVDFFRINHESYALGTRTEEYAATCELLQRRLDCTVAAHW
ncbi:MAG: DUF6259 domain-containing protein, partial [Clostridiales bacterium]|nr:DUF6259 domain-containing protein [Clostridiales bacterium]